MSKEKIPYEIKYNDKPFWVLGKPSDRLAYLQDNPEMSPAELGLIALAAFRTKSYADYHAIGLINDTEETERWIRSYEGYEWFDWMAGTVYRDEERLKQLRRTERSLGQFYVQFGWSPDVMLEDAPSDFELDGFIQHVVSKDEIGGNLVFPNEDDGA